MDTYIIVVSELGSSSLIPSPSCSSSFLHFVATVSHLTSSLFFGFFHTSHPSPSLISTYNHPPTSCLLLLSYHVIFPSSVHLTHPHQCSHLPITPSFPASTLTFAVIPLRLCSTFPSHSPHLLCMPPFTPFPLLQLDAHLPSTCFLLSSETILSTSSLKP